MADQNREKGTYSPTITLDALPRLQISDASSPSKPENYRISPITPGSSQDSSVPFRTPKLDPSTEIKADLQLIMEDWSGRGAHVDFTPDEKIPLEEGRFLGHGSMGGVYETSIRGHAFAWKKRYCRRRIGDQEKKELEILKKLSHHHIIQLVGSYTHRQFLGLLLYPVAFCDLATLLEDTEAAVQYGYGEQHGYGETWEKLWHLWFDYITPDHFEDSLKPFILPKVGCIVSAVEYLHSQKIRHKDLKPSNILISLDGLWLTDFGTATDFSTLTTSTTDNGERGTAKYFAPEVAAFERTGRAADIFSLGCIMLEMWASVRRHVANGVRALRNRHDKSFQANLDAVRNWIKEIMDGDLNEGFLLHLICAMIHRNPEIRPSITEVRKRLMMLDMVQEQKKDYLLFGSCCSTSFISTEEHKKKLFEEKLRHQNDIERYEERMKTEELQHEISIERCEQKMKDEKLKYEHAIEIFCKRIEFTEANLVAKAREKENLSRLNELEIARLQGTISKLQGVLTEANEKESENITCLYCCMAMPSHQELSQHFKHHHWGATGTKEGPDSSSTDEIYSSHTSQHRCYDCQRSFYSRRALQRHVYRQHAEDENLMRAHTIRAWA